MLNDIRQLCTFHISGDLLLYGAVELDYATNCKLFDVVHDYIEERSLIDRKTLTTMYTSFIRPGLEYGSIVFCNCTDTEDEILESVQRKKAFKIITGGIVRTPTNNLYNSGVSRNLMMCMHILKTMNSIVYLAQS